MKLKAGLAWIVITALVIGCAGRAANPVMIQQYGDDKKTCQALEREMAFIQGEIQRLIPQTQKTGKKEISPSVMNYILYWCRCQTVFMTAAK